MSRSIARALETRREFDANGQRAYDVPGSHEELGPYQIKPNTALWLLAKDVPIQNEDEARSVLELPSNNTWMSYRILQKCGLTDNMKSLVPALQRYNAGKDKLIGFFVGQVMKETGGKANPGQVNAILKDKLS